MYRSRGNQLMRLVSNAMKNRMDTNIRSIYATAALCQSDPINAMDIAKSNKSQADSREKRLGFLKRSQTDGDYDVLSEAIIKCGSIDQMMELITSHVSVMNSRHLTEAFETINDILKHSYDYDEASRKLLASDQFKQLCNQTVKRMRFFQTSEVLTTLKSVVFMNISPNTTLFQSLLQMTRQTINDFTLNEILFLDFLLFKTLKEMNKTAEQSTAESSEDRLKGQPIIPLVEALKLAIPLVMQLKIEAKELDFEDVDLLVKVIKAATKHNVKEETINKLVVAISRKRDQLNASQMYTLIAALAVLPSTSRRLDTRLIENIIYELLDTVTRPTVIQPKSISSAFLISLISHPRTRRVLYHKGLYDLACSSITESQSKIPISKVMGFMWDMTRNGHVNYSVYDLVAQRIALRDPEIIDSERISLTNVLSAFSLPSNYRPNDPQCDVVYENILNSTHVKLCEQSDSKTQHLLFQMLSHLSVLQYYPEEVITDWLTNYLEQTLSTATVIGLRVRVLENIVVLYKGLCLDSDINISDELKTKLKSLVEEYTDLITKNDFLNTKSKSLEFAITQGLGGQQFLSSNLVTDFGHVVDHLIVMRKGGFPVAIDDKEHKLTHVSQLNLPSDTHLIGIIGLTDKDYCQHPFIRRGETEFNLRTLRKSGIKPIVINLKGWDSLAEIEKVPFIMREIQENIE